LATSNLDLTPELAPRHHQMSPGRYVLLTVADTGQGMDSRTQEQIFDPFFTTKEVGKGTGLGLAMVYGIVQGHGGQVFCDSLPGRGTTFSIYLPVAAEQTAAAGKAGAAGARPRGNGEGVLLVDDEGMLRALGERLLGAAGYKVRVAGSGEEALLALEDPACPVDLVVLDLGMPGMGGLKCLKEMIALEPKAKVLVASGYSSLGHMETALAAGAAGFVAKPYRKSDLLTSVREILDGRPLSSRRGA
jgi:CheY-like chemotaxis protein